MVRRRTRSEASNHRNIVQGEDLDVETAASTGSNPARESSSNSKRSRAKGVITALACKECRKKRTKCDGEVPCSRCRALDNVECVYEPPTRQSKSNLRDEVEQLQKRQYATCLVLDALQQPKLWAPVREQLQATQCVESVSKWLQDDVQYSMGATSPALIGDHQSQLIPANAGSDFTSSTSNRRSELRADSLGAHTRSSTTALMQVATLRGIRPKPTTLPKYSTDSTAENAERISCSETLHQPLTLPEPAGSNVASWAEMSHADHIGDYSRTATRGIHEAVLSLGESWTTQGSTKTWTDVTDDIDLVQHLLSLYFCWEYPIFASLSKEHFLADFTNNRPKYCSPLLVNALLSLGCRFSGLPGSKADPEDPYSSGQHFFNEALRLLHEEADYHSILTVQALGIISIRESSCGRVAESVAYAERSMQLAVEMGLHHSAESSQPKDTDESRVRYSTFWGAFALNEAWSLATGSLPHCSKFPILPPKPTTHDHVESSPWIPYTDFGTAVQSPFQQPSNVYLVFRCFGELGELAHQTSYLLYSPEVPLTGKDLLKVYVNYLKWFNEVPDALRLGQNFTPAVLFSHMYYHFSILLLFRPIMNLRIVGSHVVPRDVCLQAAHAINTLLKSYAQLYTLTHTPTFLPHILLTSSITHLAIGILDAKYSREGEPLNLDPQISRGLKKSLDYLKEIAPCHHFAEQAASILRYLVQQWNIDIDIGNGPVIASKDYEKFVQTYSSSLNFFASDTSTKPAIGDRATTHGGSSTSQAQEAMQMLENFLLTPIPVQGAAIFLREKNLKTGGFVRA